MSLKCIIIGAGHAGVNCAFALRKEGWEGEIVLFDVDDELPYHRPPLSKDFLTGEKEPDQFKLKPSKSYKKADITLRLGERVEKIDRQKKEIFLENDSLGYDKLVLALGGRPFLPPIKNIENVRHLFTLRQIGDARKIRSVIRDMENCKAVIIGGGYIGLETAASLIKLGAEVSLLERENRILSRVTAAEMSAYYQELHRRKGVNVQLNKNVVSFDQGEKRTEVICEDGSRFEADLVMVGVGIKVNTELASEAGLEIDNGIRVDASAQSSDEDIYAIGDCSCFPHPKYGKKTRLESVQNAAEQARVAAEAICGKDAAHDSIPWFWSDQYDVKLQIVGLSQGYDELIMRSKEDEGDKFSLWYFRKDELLAVDAVNSPRDYMVGMRMLKEGQTPDKNKIANTDVEMKPAALMAN